MKKNTTSRLGLVLMLGALIVLPAAAAEGGGRDEGWNDNRAAHMGRMHERHFERLSVILDLNAQQIEQWEAVVAARKDRGKADREEMRALHEQIETMASASQPDAAAVGELVIRMQRLRNEAKAEREAMHSELMSILTPDQQERFEKMRDLRPERSRSRHGRQGRRGFHHGGGQPEGR